MLDSIKQIDYWVQGANSDIDTAGILFENEKVSAWIVFLSFND
jgi:hypothetical protein